MITIREVQGGKMNKVYIDLPYKIYADDAQWVPPLYADEKKFHDPEHNEPLGYSTTKRWLAYRNEKPVGRIMGIINHPYNDRHQQKTVRFYQLDCINDPEVAHALLHTVEEWGRGHQMDKIIGPFGFSDKDPQGAKIEGYEYPSVILTPSNPPYLPELIVKEGYDKEVDVVEYQMPVPQELPVLYNRICERARKKDRLRLIEFTRRSELKPCIIPVLRLINETYTPIFGFVPLSENEIRKLADQFIPILDPHLVKLVADSNQEAVGFVIAMPGISEGLKRSRGKLFPFGFIHILRSLRSSKQLVLLLGAVKPSFRGIGITSLLAEALFASARARGMTMMDSHVILENNRLMRAEVENLGAKICKRFRVYQKSLVL